MRVPYGALRSIGTSTYSLAVETLPHIEPAAIGAQASRGALEILSVVCGSTTIYLRFSQPASATGVDSAREHLSGTRTIPYDVFPGSRGWFRRARWWLRRARRWLVKAVFPSRGNVWFTELIQHCRSRRLPAARLRSTSNRLRDGDFHACMRGRNRLREHQSQNPAIQCLYLSRK